MEITTVGLDLAKQVFHAHGVDREGCQVVSKKLRRNQVHAFFATLAPCVVAMEACGSAHYWARRLQALGHTVKLMAPQYVKPYVKTNKNDRADAEAICHAARQPNMRFVTIKSIEQQEVLALHRARSGFGKARTAQSNQIRGLLGEYGIVLPKGLAQLFKGLPQILDDDSNELSAGMRALIHRLLEHLRQLDGQWRELERQIVAWHRASAPSRRLEAVPGIGALTASALVATAGDARNYDSGRQLASSLGIVPRQHSSGGKDKLLGISKRGDSYVRTLLIHGARSVIKAVLRKPQVDQRWAWLLELVKRRGPNVAAVALANKNARTVWALLAHASEYDERYCTA